MSTVIIVIHLMVVVAMVGLVLLQRSEGGALGIGGGGGGGAFMSGRGAANMLTRSTAVLAAAFFATSVGLALLAKLDAGQTDIFQNLPGQSQPVDSDAPVVPLPSGGSAQDMLQQLDGAAGPQTPPVEGGEAPTPPAQ